MAKFKCNQSGNVIEFLQEHEIAEMRKHGGYTEVVVEAAPVIKQTTSTSSSSKKAVKTNEISVNGDDSNSSN